MEDISIVAEPINVTKIWNWNMDDKCAMSCANVIVAHMHVLNAMTLISFLILCYLMSCIVNFTNYDKFTLTTERLLFTSVLVYSLWNIFFGFPIRKIDGNVTEVSLSYSSYAITQFMAIIFSILILYFNSPKYYNC